MTLYCEMCGAGVMPDGELPTTCPCCQLLTVWTSTEPIMPEPNEVYLLTSDDRHFLYKIRIACE